MDLHELFSTAVADLPDLPDQVPAAHRIHRRRTAVARSGAIAAACALVVGVGTLTFASPWSRHPAEKTATSASTPTFSDHGDTTEFRPGKLADAPALSGITLTGTPYSTSYIGHVTVVDVWGSWCTPCREEAPALSQAYQKYRGEGVQILGIDERDDNVAAENFQVEFSLGYPSLRDPNGTLLQEFRSFMTSVPVPSTIFVEPNGKVVAIASGASTAMELEQQIDQVLIGITP